MGRHTREFQRRWAAAYPAVELHLIHTNSATGGLAEGLCDIAVLRTPVDGNRFASAIVGHERRYCALAADDPWARPAFHQARRDTAADAADRPAYRFHHAGPVAGRRAAADPPDARHR